MEVEDSVVMRLDWTINDNVLYCKECKRARHGTSSRSGLIIRNGKCQGADISRCEHVKSWVIASMLECTHVSRGVTHVLVDVQPSLQRGSCAHIGARDIQSISPSISISTLHHFMCSGFFRTQDSSRLPMHIEFPRLSCLVHHPPTLYHPHFPHFHSPCLGTYFLGLCSRRFSPP